MIIYATHVIPDGFLSENSVNCSFIHLTTIVGFKKERKKEKEKKKERNNRQKD